MARGRSRAPENKCKKVLASRETIPYYLHMMTTQTPSQIDGKASYDADFAAGFAAGAAAYAADPDHTDACTAERAYRKVSRVHGSWWVDDARGCYAQPSVRIARALGL